MPWPHYPNKDVFSVRRNSLYDKSASFRCDGRLFHSRGPAAASKTHRVYVMLTRMAPSVRLSVRPFDDDVLLISQSRYVRPTRCRRACDTAVIRYSTALSVGLRPSDMATRETCRLQIPSIPFFSVSISVNL